MKKPTGGGHENPYKRSRIERACNSLEAMSLEEERGLKLSKLFIYDFYCNKLKEYDPNIRLFYMDTYLFFIQTSIRKNNMNESRKNTNVNRKFKDEENGLLTQEFCGLHSKLYASA